MPHDEAPDIETASEDYATRFKGDLGDYLLRVQAQTVLNLLPSTDRPLRILEVGGGHGQLVNHFLARGHEVWVHGSSPAALVRLQQPAAANPRLHLISSSLYALPFPDEHFDVVVSVRVLAHIDDPRALLREWTRLATQRVIFDYPPLESFNALYPLLFRLKKLIEKNTRVFAIYRTHTLASLFEETGWHIEEIERQFFLPMGLHRALNSPVLSARLESWCDRIGLTQRAGSPAVITAKKGVSHA